MATYIIIKCIKLDDAYETDAERRIWFVGNYDQCLKELNFYFRVHHIKDRFNLTERDYQRNPLFYEFYECDGYDSKLIETNFNL